MASIGISASIQRACSSQHVTKKVSGNARTKVAGLKLPKEQEHEQLSLTLVNNSSSSSSSDQHSQPRFHDARWKNGTWDLNMFVKEGRMDWESAIVAGRAAMVGFFMAYGVDGLTELDVVGQTGNVVCKAALLLTVVGVILFRRKEYIGNIKKLAYEADKPPGKLQKIQNYNSYY